MLPDETQTELGDEAVDDYCPGAKMFNPNQPAAGLRHHFAADLLLGWAKDAHPGRWVEAAGAALAAATVIFPDPDPAELSARNMLFNSYCSSFHDPGPAESA